MKVLILVLLGICSYFIGCISFARIISKRVMKDDITTHGSGNPGATNMYRSYGLKTGLISLFLDLLKGLIPTLVGLLILGYEGAYLAGASAILGHIYPVIYKFKGGKGIATTLGVFAICCPIKLVITLFIMFWLIYFFEYMAPVSLTAIATLVCLEAYKHAGNLIICISVFVIFVLTWFAHRANILRMLAGKENRIVLRKKRKQKLSKEKAS